MHKLIYILIICLLPATVWAQTLDDYLVIAAENNPGLKAKYLEYQASLERVPQVGSLPDPQLSFGYFILPAETRVGAQQAQFSISQMFPWFGTLGVKKDAATLLAKSKYEVFESGRNLLFYQVRKVYYQIWELDRSIDIMSKNLEILQSYESLATTKYENGQVGLVDVIRVQLSIDEADNELQVLKLRRQPIMTQFNALLNREVGTEVFIPIELENIPLSITASLDNVVVNNPLLAQIDWKAQSYEQQLLAAKKEGMPKIGIGLNYTIVQDRTDMDVPDNGQDILMPMVSISLPIYRKKYTAMQNEARYNLQSLQEDRTNIENILIADYQDARWTYSDALSRIQLYNEQIKKSESALNILITAYSSDNIDFEEVLRMQQQILKYQIQLIKAEADLRVALAEINYVTGQ